MQIIACPPLPHVPIFLIYFKLLINVYWKTWLAVEHVKIIIQYIRHYYRVYTFAILGYIWCHLLVISLYFRCFMFNNKICIFFEMYYCWPCIIYIGIYYLLFPAQLFIFDNGLFYHLTNIHMQLWSTSFDNKSAHYNVL